MGFKMNSGKTASGTGFSVKSASKASEMYGTSPLMQREKQEAVTLKNTAADVEHSYMGVQKPAVKDLERQALIDTSKRQEQKEAKAIEGAEQKKEYLLDYLGKQVFNPQTKAGEARRKGRAERSDVRDVARTEKVESRNVTKMEKLKKKYPDKKITNENPTSAS